jgi:hypothetical protein
MNLRTLFFCVGLGICATGFAHADSTKPDASATTAARDGTHDFDFWFGRWNGVHRKLQHRLAHSNEWEDFSGTAFAKPLLGGRSNMDENVFHSGVEGAGGVGVRFYNSKTHLWSIYWLGTTGNTFDSPMVGSFVDGVGTFYGDDTWEGKPVRVRFIWSKIDLTHCHWEQAYSADSGKTWETNWLMDFTRAEF